MNEKTSQEIIYKSSLSGIHRDDLLFELGDRNASLFASQGQVRSIVLSLKFSVINHIVDKTGDLPIVLLDDLNSELDEKRTKFLFNYLLDNKQQIFVTGTSVPNSLLHSDDVEVFQIQGGSI